MGKPKTIRMGGWELSWVRGQETVHGLMDVIPVDDLKEHVYGGECWCKPVDDEGVWLHSSADGRERLEQGLAAPH